MCEDLTGPDDVAVVATRVAEALEAPARLGDVLVELRATVGTATSDGSHEPGALLVAADQDMSRIKRARPT